MTLFEQKVLYRLEKTKILTSLQVKDLVDKLDLLNLSFEEYLIRKYKIKEDVLLGAKGKISEVPIWRYDETKLIKKDILRIIPQEAASQYGIIPIQKKEKKLIVGMVDPTNLKAQQALRFILLRSELRSSVVTITERDLQKVLILYKGLKVEVKSALEEIEKSLQEEPEKKGETGKYSEIKETPVTKIVGVILKHAIEGKASDIHIEPLRVDTRVRFRVDGILYSSLILPAAIHDSIVARIKILSTLRLDESRIPQDGRFSMKVGGKLIDFRTSTFPTNLGEKVVMRVLDPSAVILEFKELGLVGENKRRVDEALNSPSGMILVSGPTGSGKTTTLYAAISKVNKDIVNVVSLEDPIEYYIEGVSQSQIKPEIDYTFASGLRHMLRQDPDIIMVGEIRDSETAELAVQASLTGHLVFSTIHTNNAIGVIPRLIDLGVGVFLIPSAIKLTIAQRLIGKLCNYCKHEEDIHSKIIHIIDEELAKIPKDLLDEYNIQKPYKLWRSKGCSRCNNKGTKGRIGVYEVLLMTSELKKIILEDEASGIEIEKEAEMQGMITMKQDGIIKALQGIISIEDVLRVVKEE